MPTACGIETRNFPYILLVILYRVATVPTACGIETCIGCVVSIPLTLQQCLPLAVLKHDTLLSHLPLSGSCNSAYRLRY